MKKLKYRVFSLSFLFVLMFNISSSASVLGSSHTEEYQYEISDGLTLYENTFLSDQSGVGEQRENYFHYIPGGKTLPVVTVGKYVYGGENINKIYEYLKENDINAVGGINGDFFALQTGIPMGHAVIDGKIVTDENELLPAIGFKDDGSAFISDYKLDITMKFAEEEVSLPYFNKYLQKWNYYLFDSDYYSKIQSDKKASFVTFEIEEGTVKIGETIKTKVVKIEKDIEGDKELSENQLVLAVTEEATDELKAGIDKFYEEQEVEFTFHTNDDEKWSEAKYVLASKAGQLIKNSEAVMTSNDTASPRTAVGIKEDGSVIFYTIDGRQPGYSYGLRIPTLIKRLLELGCVDALNLDGGGSTTIGAVYAGYDEMSVVNSPSEGRLRNDSTYIFFENTSKKDENEKKDGKLFVYPSNVKILSGSKTKFTVKATDSGYYATTLPKDISFYIDGKSEITNETEIIAKGDGEQKFVAKAGDTEATAKILCVETPDKIIAKKDGKDGEKIEKIELLVDEEIKLDVEAYYKNSKLIADENVFSFSVGNEEICQIDEKGVFKAIKPGKTEIIISAGEYSLSIPVKIKSDGRLVDIEENWAKEYIEFLYEKKVVTGEEGIDGYFYFKPFEQVSRNQLAVILSKALKLDTEEYKDVILPFEDKDDIPSWAYPHVQAVYSEEILKGALMEDKLYFNPSSKITRAEAFTTVGRILDLSYEEECQFSDREDIPSWAKEYIDALFYNKVINGYDDNTLKPLSNVTKAELSKIIVKAIYNEDK